MAVSVKTILSLLYPESEIFTNHSSLYLTNNVTLRIIITISILIIAQNMICNLPRCKTYEEQTLKLLYDSFLNQIETEILANQKSNF